MPPAKVVDTSVIAAILFGEPKADVAAARLTDARLMAPVFMDFELANVCVKKCRAHPDRATDYLTGLGLRSAFAIELYDVAHREVVGLALELGLSAYDASYLWLARRHHAELVTFDRALERAWTSK